MGRTPKPPITPEEIEVALAFPLREAAWKISEMRGAANRMQDRVSKSWVNLQLSKNGLVHKRQIGKHAASVRVLSTNGVESGQVGPHVSNNTTPVVLEEKQAPLSPASTGPEITPSAVLGDASRPEAAK